MNQPSGLVHRRYPSNPPPRQQRGARIETEAQCTLHPRQQRIEAREPAWPLGLGHAEEQRHASGLDVARGRQAFANRRGRHHFQLLQAEPWWIERYRRAHEPLAAVVQEPGLDEPAECGSDGVQVAGALSPTPVTMPDAKIESTRTSSYLLLDFLIGPSELCPLGGTNSPSDL